METQNAIARPPARRPARRSRAGHGSWQAEKSHLMRMHILDATMQCLVNIGYSQTTTEKIAKQAGVSRGAMTHHFKSRADVFNAAAEHITDIRVTEYDEAIRGVTQKSGSFPTADNMRDTIVALQSYYMKPSFLAFQELVRGARTDEQLQEVMGPLENSLDEWMSLSMVRRFPIWADEDMREVGEALRDLIMHSLQGVAMNPAPYLQGDRLARLHDLLVQTAMAQFKGIYEARQEQSADA